jgi:hypothetical protein
MFDLRQIVENHNRTFYDYASNTRKSVRPRYVTLALLAIALALLFPRQSDDFLNAVLTAQAILVGFSFNVLFFLLSNGEPTPDNETSLERGLRRAKVERLSKELFHNISYYNLVTISSVVLAFTLMSSAMDGAIGKFAREWLTENIEHVPSIASVYAGFVCQFVRYIAFATLYFLLLESLFTFYRTVFRVSYFFEKRLELRREN